MRVFSQLLLIGAIGLGASSAWAQALPERAERPVESRGVTAPVITSHTTTPTVRLQSVQAPADYVVFDSLANAYSYYNNDQSPLVYDPVSGVLATILRGNGGTTSSGDIFIRVSTDMGDTWMPPIGPLHDESATGPGRYPSLAIANPLGTTDLSQILLIYTFPILTAPAGGGSPTFGQFETGAVTGDGLTLGTTVSTDASGFTWGSGNKIVITKDGMTAVAAGSVSDPAGIADGIGVQVLDLNTLSASATVPAQLDGSNFRSNASTGGRYSGILNMEVDAQGTIWLALTGIPADDQSRLRVGVTSSTDNGTTWSPINWISDAAISDYGVAQGAPADSSWIVGYDGDMTVTGNGDVHIMKWLEGIDQTANQVLYSNLVDLTYSGGSWSGVKIADYSGFTDSLDNEDGSGLAPSQTGGEFQLRPTSDNSKLIAKWLESYRYISQQDFNGDGVTPDTIATTDVVAAGRIVSSNSYGDMENVTNSVTWDRITWIPTILPASATNIPLLTVQTATDASVTNDSLRYIGLQRMLLHTQYVTMSHFDVTNFSAGVRASTSASHSLSVAVAPNPASTAPSVQMTFTHPADVTLEVYGVDGQRVYGRTLGTVPAGPQTLSLQGANLGSGSYLLRVRADGETVTQMFNIVR